MLKIKRDTNLQDLKIVDLHFVKSEQFLPTWSCRSRQRDTTSNGWKFKLHNLALKEVKSTGVCMLIFSAQSDGGCWRNKWEACCALGGIVCGKWYLLYSIESLCAWGTVCVPINRDCREVYHNIFLQSYSNIFFLSIHIHVVCSSFRPTDWLLLA